MTNKEGRPLILVSSKDGNGKMFTIMRVFLPNQQAWAYHWLFQSVFPLLLGKEYLLQVKMIVTDGDPQETSQLDIAISKFMPSTYQPSRY